MAFTVVSISLLETAEQMLQGNGGCEGRGGEMTGTSSGVLQRSRRNRSTFEAHELQQGKFALACQPASQVWTRGGGHLGVVWVACTVKGGVQAPRD